MCSLKSKVWSLKSEVSEWLSLTSLDDKNAVHNLHLQLQTRTITDGNQCTYITWIKRKACLKNMAKFADDMHT